MLDHDLLHRELSTFASTLTDDFDIVEALRRVSSAAASALALEGAGITLRLPAGDTQLITATDDRTMHVERKQDELQQGACIDAMTSSQVVSVEDLAKESRWPDFRPIVLEAGFRASAGVPIRFRGDNVGAVNLYGDAPRAWATEELTAGQLVADLAAGYLVNSYLLRDSQILAEQLQRALDSRVIIEQAKGILAGRHGVAPDDAFEFLRAHSRNVRQNLHDVALAIVRGTIDPMEEGDGGRADHEVDQSSSA